MKVITIPAGGGFNHLKPIDRPDPSPGADEILVQWHATSLNYHDYLVALGAIPVPENRIPMSDGAGEILAVGTAVKDWKVGDRVMSLFFPKWTEGRATPAKTRGISGESLNGFMVEKSCVNAREVTTIPLGYSFSEAATLPCAGLTAWRALVVEGRIKPGDSVLVEGSGGMSIFALQIAKAAGARIFATSSSADKAERLQDMGVEKVINYKTDLRWGKTIYKLAGGGVDHVLDVGGGSTMQNSIEAAAMGGHVYSIGILGGGRKGEITFPKFFFKHMRMTGLAVGSREMQQDMVRAINISGIRPVIDRSFAFDELGEAFKYQESGAHFGKIVVDF